MAELDQVRDGRLGRGHIVDRDVRDVELVPAHRDDGHALLAQALYGQRDRQRAGRVAELAADQHDAGGLLGEQHGEVALELDGVAVVVADEHDEPVGDGGVLQAAHDDAEEGVGDVVDDGPDDLAAAGDQGGRGRVRHVAERPRRLFDTQPGAVAHRIRRTRQHP